MNNTFDRKADIDHFAKSVEQDVIAANGYNLSVSSYVEAEDTRELIDIAKLNAENTTYRNACNDWSEINKQLREELKKCGK